MVENDITGEVVLHYAIFFFFSKSETLFWETGFYSF